MAKKHNDLPIQQVTDLNPNDNYRIGIDPDTTASGIAIFNRRTKQYEAYYRIAFFDLFDLLDNLLKYGYKFEVVIEAGWRNPSKMHNVKGYATRAKAAAIGANVGANHECGRKIVEMCQYFGTDPWLLTPTSSKWTPTMLHHLTNIELSANQQDIIDAMRLVYEQ